MTAKTPFEYLATLSLDIKKTNPSLPSQEAVQANWSGIGFSILGQRLIAPLGEVVEMLTMPEVTRLPGVQPWVMGVSNVRGRLLPMFDLEAFFGGSLSANKLRHRVLVLEMGELYAGLVVSDVYGMYHFSEEVNLDAGNVEDAEHLTPYSQGSYEHGGVDWLTFSPFTLVRDPRFFNAANS